jgi:hypothetical protein
MQKLLFGQFLQTSVFLAEFGPHTVYWDAMVIVKRRLNNLLNILIFIRLYTLFLCANDYVEII